MRDVIMYSCLILCVITMVIAYVVYNIKKSIKEERAVLREMESSQFKKRITNHCPYNWANENVPLGCKIEEIVPPYESTGEARAIGGVDLNVPTFIRQGKELGI